MDMINLSGGWIYVLLSSADYGRCKIGKTINNPLVRYRQLRTGDPCLALVVAYYIPKHFGPIKNFETRIHNAFNDFRINNHEEGKSEWFEIDTKTAELNIDVMLEGWCNQKFSDPSRICLEVLTKMYESDIRALFDPDPHDLELVRIIFGDH